MLQMRSDDEAKTFVCAMKLEDMKKLILLFSDGWKDEEHEREGLTEAAMCLWRHKIKMLVEPPPKNKKKSSSQKERGGEEE